MSLGSKLLVLSAIIAIMAGGHACSRERPPPATRPTTPTPTPTPTPINLQALLQESGRVMEDLRSFRFLLEHPSGGTPLALLPGLAMQDAEGSVINPDKLIAHFGGALGSLYIKASLITLGEESYMTNPITGQWEKVPPEISPLGFFNPRKGIASMMTRIEQASLLPDSGDVSRIIGRIPAEALAPLLGTTVKGTTVSVELTIDTDDLYLLKARFEGRVTPAEPDGTVRVITLSGFNEPITIEPPR